jgi:hypothetical protein
MEFNHETMIVSLLTANLAPAAAAGRFDFHHVAGRHGTLYLRRQQLDRAIGVKESIAAKFAGRATP